MNAANCNRCNSVPWSSDASSLPLLWAGPPAGMTTTGLWTPWTGPLLSWLSEEGRSHPCHWSVPSRTVHPSKRPYSRVAQMCVCVFYSNQKQPCKNSGSCQNCLKYLCFWELKSIKAFLKCEK